MSDSIPLTCTTCGLPFGRIKNGCLVIESRHHGEKHTNSVSLEWLTAVGKVTSMSPEDMKAAVDKIVDVFRTVT